MKVGKPQAFSYCHKIKVFPGFEKNSPMYLGPLDPKYEVELLKGLCSR
jgi:hypothetical protein